MPRLPYAEHEVHSIPEQEVIAPLLYFGALLPATRPVSTGHGLTLEQAAKAALLVA